MSGSRANDNDRKRVYDQVTGADQVVRRQIVSRCLEAVNVWNDQIKIWHRVEPSPAIGVLMNAGHYWVDVKCNGCRQVTSLDLRTVNRHELTPAANLTLWLRCKRCATRGGDPYATVLGSRAAAPETVADRAYRLAQEKFERENKA